MRSRSAECHARSIRPEVSDAHSVAKAATCAALTGQNFVTCVCQQLLIISQHTRQTPGSMFSYTFSNQQDLSIIESGSGRDWQKRRPRGCRQSCVWRHSFPPDQRTLPRASRHDGSDDHMQQLLADIIFEVHSPMAFSGKAGMLGKVLAKTTNRLVTCLVNGVTLDLKPLPLPPGEGKIVVRHSSRALSIFITAQQGPAASSASIGSWPASLVAL